jgi:TonB family protein
MLKPDPTRYPRLMYTHIANGPEWVEPDSAEHGEGSNGASASRPQEELFADSALDLRLNEILQQARLATAATGAVIALARGEEMVCRATSGDKAPSLGIGVTRSGLSAACVQTREMQRCDDTLTDLRVNAIACRDLDIRSILVLPVLDGEKLWGIFEVFSSAPRAFSDSDVQTLEALSRKISHTVHEACEGSPWAQAADTPPHQQPKADPAQPQVMAREILHRSGLRDLGVRGRDYRTGALTAAVIALAILLGWMVGRAGWSMAVNRAPSQLPIAPPEEAQAAEQAPADTGDVRASPGMKEPTSSAKPIRVTPARSALSKPATKSKAVLLPGGLVVYENGKVVFQMAPSEKTLLSGSEKTFIEPQASIQSAVGREGDSSPPVQTALQAPISYLLERVEPEYPEEAKQQHIQGPVVLNALVGTDGSVRELKVISGDPKLIKAAVDAVSQWRFQPHRLEGQLVEFETQIVVNFALPPSTP